MTKIDRENSRKKVAIQTRNCLRTAETIGPAILPEAHMLEILKKSRVFGLAERELCKNLLHKLCLHLRRRINFSEVLPEEEIVVTLSRQLSWFNL
ncbi:MAG: hypothetical protein PHT13_09440 [Methanosarcina sp.]|nr:hypothetical protein [Methanosarcina sp.]